MEKYELLTRSKTRKPNRLMYKFFGMLIGGGVRRKVNIKFVNCDMISQCKEPFVVLANHVSRSDFVFSALACKQPLHFVATEYEFYNKVNYRFMKQLGAIPKYLYQKDNYSTREMIRVARRGGNLMIFPEGILSITGGNRPIIPGTGRFLQKLGLKIFVLKLSGAYSVRPRFGRHFSRGNVTIEASLLVDATQLQQYNGEQLDDMIRTAIAHDENAYMATQPPMKPNKDGWAYNMNSTLYHCPCCDSEGTVQSDGNYLHCTHCGAKAEVDGRLSFNDVEGYESFGYRNISEWWQYQSNLCGDIIDKGGVYISDTADVFTIDKSKVSKYPFKQVGRGKVWLDEQGLHYDGINNGEPFQWLVPMDSQPSMPAGKDNFVESYYNGQYYRFMLDNNAVSMKWTCISAEYNRRGGKWPI